MTKLIRNGRAFNEMRPVAIELNYIKNAEGSCLVSFGETKVICTATVEEKVPPFLKGKKEGWVTAEYSMLPRATTNRTQRESTRPISGRTHEIQRLIGRSLRTAINLSALGERQIIVDCDVIHADGGTRTASITGGFVALCQAVKWLYRTNKIKTIPIKAQVAAVSCGIVRGELMVDLDYSEDNIADVDANFVINSEGKLIEVQASAENGTFMPNELDEMIKIANSSIAQLLLLQRQILGL
jgi:ribonuclease PH